MRYRGLCEKSSLGFQLFYQLTAGNLQIFLNAAGAHIEMYRKIKAGELSLGSVKMYDLTRPLETINCRLESS